MVSRWILVGGVVALFGATLSLLSETGRAQDKSASAQPDEAAVARSRKVTQLLDNIFKQTIVLITDKYVHDESDFAAGSAAVLLFEKVSQSGDHQVRLLDATGEPYDPENVARDAFEREGIQRLKSGAKLHEQVVQVDGKPRLRTLTPVPVVMKKCVMCHEHYGQTKPGEVIGAISYIVPVE
jgi:hypothetical protein